MVDRRDLGSWLQGPGGSSEPGSTYPGERLGRPASGPGSIASTGRRFVALAIDWALCLLIVRGLVGADAVRGLLPVAVLVLENALLVPTAGATFGQRLVGVRVERVADARPPTLGGGLARSVLLGLGFPALTLLWERDARGLHELAAGTVVARR